MFWLSLISEPVNAKTVQIPINDTVYTCAVGPCIPCTTDCVGYYEELDCLTIKSTRECIIEEEIGNVLLFTAFCFLLALFCGYIVVDRQRKQTSYQRVQ